MIFSSQGPELLDLEQPDLVLPGISGFELLQRIREFSGVLVIFLAASNKEEGAVRALKMGADDCITKPFSPRELVARLKACFIRWRSCHGGNHCKVSIQYVELDSYPFELTVKLFRDALQSLPGNIC